ncbi:MAG: hypothetical protein Q7T72_03990 [Bacteroidales bacterium]|nr:hypothetical protein [Bacteroidales bacterium]MDP3003640.1 hypothetical protein [Bacteroidales bacterium]
MKRKSFKLIVSLILMMVVSCDEPETVVTNYVHPDGSMTRKIEMKSIEDKVENRFKISDLQVPFDSTWTVKDSCEVSEKGDTTWIRRAVKLFKNVDEINLGYKTDSGANKEISRRAGFKKRFKWFNTEFRFSETIDKKLSFGYPVSDFLNKEELLYFYSPENVNDEKENGPDSLKFRALNDSVSHKTDTWTSKNLVSEWIGEFSKLTEGKSGNDMSMESLKAREDEFVKIVEANNEKFDSLWSNGILLKEFIGEANALKYKTEADSAISIVTNNFWVNFKRYSVRIVIPGKVIGTNGFIDSSQVLLWPVKSDYFLTEPYQMWAESKVPNRWAWIVSGLFLVFVLTGVIIRVIKKG